MLRNIGSNWALALVQVVVLIQLTPVQVHALGNAVNGVWLAIASLTSILGLLILGVPMASVRFITEHVARRETERANQAIATCLAVTLTLGAAAVGVGAGLSIYLERGPMQSAEWQALGPAVLREARVAYWLVVAQIGLGFAGQLPFGILDAHHDFVARNGVKLAGLLLRAALIVGVLRVHASLVVLGVVQLGVMLTELGVALLIIRRKYPEIRFGIRGFDRDRLRAILGFSAFVLLLNMGSQLAFQCDQLVISSHLSPEQGTFFDVGNKFFPALTGLVLGIGMVVMPMATKLQATGDMEELRHVFLKWSKVAFSIGLCACGYLIVLAPKFVGWWMGPAFAGPSGRITRLLAVAFLFFLPVRGVASPLLMGLGKAAQPALALLAMGVVNLAASLVLVHPFGIFGVALGTAVPCVLYSVVVAFLGCRAVAVPFATYLRYVIGRPVAGALVPVLLLVALRRAPVLVWCSASRTIQFVYLAVAGLAMLAVFGATWLVFVYRDDPYFDLAAKAGRFLPRALRGRTP